MKKWMLLSGVVLVAGFMAAPAPAQEPISLPKTVVTSGQPMTVAQPSGGLFSRMRARRGVTTTVNQPIVQTRAIEAPGKVDQAQATQPAPMPVQPQVMPERRPGLLGRLRDRRN